MKKTLIAFAALSAIAGVAQAQSSVTLYGLVDASVGHRDTTVAGTKTSANLINSSGQNNSRFGFRGTEDLGGGLKAIFNMEAGFNTDDGAGNQSGGNLFSRQAFVGLSGGFGTVKLGRLYTAYDALRGATNMVYDTNFATTGTAWGSGVADYAARTSNGFAYESPVFGGFSGGFVVGTGEDKIAAAPPAPSSSASRNVSLHIKYANGPLLVGYAHQNQKFNAGTTIASTTPVGVAVGPVKYNLIAGSYDFGVAKLTGGYNTASQSSPSMKDKEFQVGVSVPFGAAALAAGYARSKTDNSVRKGTGLSLLGTYSLSKRTNLYAGVLNTELVTPLLATTVTTKVNDYRVGVKHTF
jgi:predicted porin